MKTAQLEVRLVGYTIFEPPLGLDGDETRYLFTPDDMTLIDPENGTYDGQALAEFSGRACYQSWNKTNPATATNAGYLANILDHVHHSVLEHASVTFYITGVSRALTHELVRHRHFSYSQLSQRYVDSSDIAFVIPPADDMDPEALTEHTEAYDTALRLYNSKVQRKLALGYSRKAAREAARAHLPNEAETKIVVTGNYRAWMEFLIKRDNPAADAEIRRLAIEIGSQLAGHAPHVFGTAPRALWDTSAAQAEANA
jgi:thymidylate synthase (FAD)